MLTIYGIPNCDSCRKARKWLDQNAVLHRFHDLRTDGLDRVTLCQWAAVTDWKKLLNTRSATWRGLAEADKHDLDEAGAIELMLAHPTLVKRPVAELDGSVTVGFSVDDYEAMTR